MVLSAIRFSSTLCRAVSLSKSLTTDDEQSQSSNLSLPSTHKWRMVIAYDGTKFSGWQYQESPPTIQCLVEKALTKITKLDRKELSLVGASRTDAGVHACGQVAHFVTPFKYDNEGVENFHAAINGLLPSSIRVREFSPAKSDFHARFSTISKLYHYKIYNGPIMDPFLYLYAYHNVYKINPNAMRKAASYFVGKHDFTSFANAIQNNHVRDPVKEIFRFDVTEMVVHSDSVLQLEVEGSGFLYKQVRNMVALLLQIGREVLPPYIVPKIVSARDRKVLAKVAFDAPPHGLSLMSIKYDEKLLEPPENSPPISFGRTRQSRRCKLPF